MKTLVSIGLLAASVAYADDKVAAERYFRAGAKAYQAQNFGVAAMDFEEAYKQYPVPEIAFSAAQAYRRLYLVQHRPDDVRRSVELYRSYLEKVKTGGRVGDAADNLQEMQHELERLERSGARFTAAPQVEHTRLGVSVTVTDQGDSQGALREVGDATGELVKGLKATIDGKPADPFALVDVDAREHVLAASADGYFPVEKKAVAVQGQSQLIELELRPRPAKVHVITDAGAQVAVDGRPASTLLDLPAGNHVVTVMRRGRQSFSRELAVTRGEDLKLEAPLQPTGRRRAVPWVMSGAGAIAIVAGATGILAVSHDNDASSLQKQIRSGNAAPSVADRYDQEVQSRDHFVSATWILGGTAVAACAVGAFLYFFDTPSTEGLQIAPVASPGGGGVTFGGRF
jgi:hypothetical protein